jgi:hypothetical protein
MKAGMHSSLHPQRGGSGRRPSLSCLRASVVPLHQSANEHLPDGAAESPLPDEGSDLSRAVCGRVLELWRSNRFKLFDIGESVALSLGNTSGPIWRTSANESGWSPTRRTRASVHKRIRMCHRCAITLTSVSVVTLRERAPLGAIPNG